MLITDIKYLITALIGIDIIFFVFFIILIRRLSYLKRKDKVLEKEIKVFESLIKDADKMAGQFTEQLKAKYQFVKKMNDQLDKRIASLNILLNRSDIILSSVKELPENKRTGPAASRQNEILALAQKGYDTEKIAGKLSIAKGEVMLVLNLKKPAPVLGLKQV